jgi:hypothetical protein
MQWSSFSSLSQDQTTWSVFILWIIFDHFSIGEEFLGFFYTDTTNDTLVNSRFGKLNCPASIFSRISSISAMLN